MRFSVSFATPAFVALSVLGCAHRRSVPLASGDLRARAPVALEYAAASRTPTDALAARAERVATAFRAVGARPFADMTAAFVTREGAAVWRIRASRDGCLGAVGVTHPGFENLEAEVFNAAGVRLEHDGPERMLPYVRVCARAGDVLYVALRSGRTSDGEVALLAMANPPVTPPDLDAVLGQRSAANFAAPPTVHVDLGVDPTRWDPRAALATAEARFHVNGYSTYGPPRGNAALEGELDNGREELRALLLRSNRCYAIAGAAGPGVTALDLRVIGPDNEVVDRDSREQPRPVLRFCPEQDGLYTLIARVERGAGAWAAAIFERGRDAVVDGVEGGPALRGIAAELSAEARRGGFRAVGEPQRLITPGNGAAWFGHFVVRASRCYLFAIAATPNAGALESSLETSEGGVASADSAGFLASRLYYCAPRGGTLRWRVASGGRGEATLMQFESAPSVEREGP